MKKQSKPIDNSMCDRFKLIRTKLEFNIINFAKELETYHSTISDIENHKLEPSKELIKKAIEKFNIDANYIFSGEGEMFRAEPCCTAREKKLEAEVRKLKDELKQYKDVVRRINKEAEKITEER